MTKRQPEVSAKSTKNELLEATKIFLKKYNPQKKLVIKKNNTKLKKTGLFYRHQIFP